MKIFREGDDIDADVRRELVRARIVVIEGEPQRGEVPTRLTGALGNFTFVRAWRYWMVEGKVPLAVARKLYDDPVGCEDVRVAGHCGCPPPEFPWVEHVDAQGRFLYRFDDREQVLPRRHLESESALIRAAAEEVLATCRWVEDPEAVAFESYVGSYHIDTEVGLRLFADTIRRHLGLAADKDTSAPSR